MQFSDVLNIFIVKTLLNIIFTNDLKRKYLFRQMFIVTDLASLNKFIGIINFVKHFLNSIDDTII